MGNQKIPDAWDEDWETQADRAAQAEQKETPAPQAPKSKAERWAEHRELNRQIWEAAYVFPIPEAISPSELSYSRSSPVRHRPRCTT